jgi:hypothetical protein
MNEQYDPNSPESVERAMLDPAERISVTTPMPQPIDDLDHAPAVPTPQPVQEPVPEPAPVEAPEERPRRSGPAPVSLVLGVLLLAATVVMALHETVGFRVDWAVTGPVVLVGGGVVLALAGLIGMRRS